ncbi:Beta-amylase [Zea mays]|uniref:Beta-amylase n=1 Tax=Zea mays TaxID=4577 RepID=A0A1D6GPU2_MAIZE|nr:Beta-amylase [Zea mays]
MPPGRWCTRPPSRCGADRPGRDGTEAYDRLYIQGLGLGRELGFLLGFPLGGERGSAVESQRAVSRAVQCSALQLQRRRDCIVTKPGGKAGRGGQRCFVTFQALAIAGVCAGNISISY